MEELYAVQSSTNGGAAPFLWLPSYEATAAAAAVTEQEVVYGKLSTPRFEFSIPDFQLYNPSEFVIRSLGREIGA